ncbi:MAG: bifunctional uridylyltransferase/uridylyl-removing enzyme [Paracoccaceae bacterium]|nr:MAG: [protein-PII] uridylyltransferase [Alphaproteobacteria bacterium]GIX13773.1 MAG: bifunctional uridylyltransferase/uridylyl-removing enzyme [Paracoccaceae bacterium]
MDSPSLTRPRDASTAPPDDAAGPLILPAREIVDPDALRARLDEALGALAREGADAAARRAAAVEILRAARGAGRAAIDAAFEARPRAGRAAAASHSHLTDAIVTAAIHVARRWLHPLPNPTASERMAVLATGGYGRGEMAPHSDIDLMFLTPWKQTAWGESMIESVLYMLWDLRFKVGHAVRTVEDCLRLGREDITIRTALLERRFLEGERALAEELEARLWADLFSSTGPQFVEAKLAERDERHRRQGGSRYLVEPNVKEGKGGLRDLQTLYWIAKYLYRAGTPQELVARGVFTGEEVAVFSAAEDFLWAVRCHLHRLAGRAAEQLTFDMQVEIARIMGFTDGGGRRAVENFMQLYYTHAKNVGELTRIFCSVLEAQHVKTRTALGPRLRRAFRFGRRLEEGFVERDGRLDFADPARVADQPILLMRIFRAALQTGLRMHPAAMRTLAACTDLVAGLRSDPEAARLFQWLILDSGDPERALRRMNETGVLGAYLPEFGDIVCLMQFNMYHHYTVDEHTITCIAVLNRIERGELAAELPVATEIMRQGVDRAALYFALLMHDVGKGRPGDHSETGAELARAVGARLGLDPGTVAVASWLVRHHLLMSDTAQKRDIADPRTVKDFARIVQTPERLKLLLVLTACDIMGVGPGVWNNWKAQLLRQLFFATRAELTGDADASTRAAREEAAKAAFAEAYGRTAPPEAVARELARHYAGYWLGFDTDTQLIFARLGEGIGPGEIACDFITDPGRDATKAVFYMEDHPGIFARMAGALSIAGANVVDARTYTTSDGFATMAFWIQDRNGRPYAESRLDRLRRSVERMLKGEISAREEFRVRDRVKRRVADFTVPTRILFDNDGSDIFTIIEISARDRPGLLYDLARTLSSLGISISSAVIATYGEQAVDVFYVKDLFGLKIRSESKRRTIEERLRAAIDGPSARGGERPSR